MKKLIYSLALFAIAFYFASCTSKWLDVGYEGSRISADQVDNAEFLINGIYQQLFREEISGHDAFGQRKVDLATDMLCGDIAMSEQGNRWFFRDDKLKTNEDRQDEIWAYYYKMLASCNYAIKFLDNKTSIQTTLNSNGLPSTSNEYAYTEEEIEAAVQLARIKIMRGFALSKIAMLYTPAPNIVDIISYKCGPVYDENNLNTTLPFSSSERVFKKAIAEFNSAIQIYENSASYLASKGGVVTRNSKLDVDPDVARGLLAYTYLNLAPYYETSDPTQMTELYTNALQNAETIMSNGHYQLLSQDKLFSTGFNDVSEDCWMWGEDVTTETTTMLNSWFAQVDIFTYFYAFNGPKQIDAVLYDSIYTWDGRKQWFLNDPKNTKYYRCPTKKFYSAINNVLEESKLDRQHLSDNIFMRYESIYLIAAEAAYQLNNLDKAKQYIFDITDKRMDTTNTNYQTDYNNFKTTLTTQEAIKNFIGYNWRVEMWGEGYGLQTLKRLNKTVRRGSNHSQNDEVPNGSFLNVAGNGAAYFIFSAPRSERTYNPQYNDPVIKWEGE